MKSDKINLLLDTLVNECQVVRGSTLWYFHPLDLVSSRHGPCVIVKSHLNILRI